MTLPHLLANSGELRELLVFRVGAVVAVCVALKVM